MELHPHHNILGLQRSIVSKLLVPAEVIQVGHRADRKGSELTYRNARIEAAPRFNNEWLFLRAYLVDIRQDWEVSQGLWVIGVHRPLFIHHISVGVKFERNVFVFEEVPIVIRQELIHDLQLELA